MQQEKPLRVRRVEITREPRLRRLASVPAALAFLQVFGAMAAITFGGEDRALAAFGLFWLWLLVFCAAAMAPLAFLARRRIRGKLALAPSAGELALVDESWRARWRLPWSEIGVAWMRAPRVVEIATASGDEALLYFESPREAATAVTALQARARDRRAYPLSLRTDSGQLWRQTVAWLGPAILAPLAAGFGPPGLLAAPIALSLGAIAARGSGRIVLGADGVIAERRFGRVYVPYRDIEKVELTLGITGRALMLRLKDGSRVRLGRFLDGTRASLAEALLSEGLRMVERGEAAGASSASLTQRGEAPDELMRELSSRAKKSGYRAPALDAERLVSIVRNPAADGAQRIAAALALRAEPSGPARIRVAAEVSNEPEVRDVLEALSSESVDEVRVERALKRLASARR